MAVDPWVAWRVGPAAWVASSQKSRTSCALLWPCGVPFPAGLFEPSRLTSGICMHANRGVRTASNVPIHDCGVLRGHPLAP